MVSNNFGFELEAKRVILFQSFLIIPELNTKSEIIVNYSSSIISYGL